MDCIKGFIDFLKDPDTSLKTLSFILLPWFTLGCGLLIGAWSDSITACNTPSDADFCYVCDAEQRKGTCCSLCGDCNNQGGCWCKGYGSLDYYCRDTDWGTVVIYAVSGSIAMIPFIPAIILVIYGRCACCRAFAAKDKAQVPLIETGSVIE